MVSVALDESTDVLETSQLLLFFCSVGINSDITEEFAFVCSMHETTTDADILKNWKIRFVNSVCKGNQWSVSQLIRGNSYGAKTD